MQHDRENIPIRIRVLRLCLCLYVIDLNKKMKGKKKHKRMHKQNLYFRRIVQIFDTKRFEFFQRDLSHAIREESWDERRNEMK